MLFTRRWLTFYSLKINIICLLLDLEKEEGLRTQILLHRLTKFKKIILPVEYTRWTYFLATVEDIQQKDTVVEHSNSCQPTSLILYPNSVVIVAEKKREENNELHITITSECSTRQLLAIPEE